MLWFDLGTPKSVLFFKPLIERLTERGDAPLVTSRGGAAYGEIATLLDVHDMDAVSVGEYGGDSLVVKLEASLTRQRRLLDLIGGNRIDRLVCLCNVDSCRVAFGLGIPVVNFCDLPTRGDGEPLTAVARLTLPLSAKILHPFVVPQTIFTPFLGRDDVVRYDFLDPILYLRNQTPNRALVDELPLDATKKTVCFREEEEMASYVMEDQTWVFDALNGIDANIIAIPRYGSDRIRQLLPGAVVMDQGVELSAVLPFADLMVGGGGTINIEAAYWGTPVVSTRSFISHYDRYLIAHGLMHHARTPDQLKRLYETLSDQRTDPSILTEQSNHASVEWLLQSMGE
jgi:predicted glycosyltransferase